MCSADFTCANGSTIQSVLRELLLKKKLMGFRKYIFKKQFVFLLFSVRPFILLVENMTASI